MKKLILPLTAAAGGAAAFLLRLWQNHTGFEQDTGLPIPGALSGILLVLWLAALAAVLLALSCKLPQESGDGPAFPAAFPAKSTGAFTLVISGIFLMAVSGAWDLAAAFGDAVSVSGSLPLSPKGQILMGALTLLSAAGLFPAAAACRRDARGEGQDIFQNWMLLIPPVCLVARLVLVYRTDSMDPAPEAYYVELLALVFLTLAFYRLSSFAYQAGQTRRFALYAALAVVLSLAALNDGYGPADTLLYAGGAASLLGFLSLRLLCPPPENAPEMPADVPAEPESGGKSAEETAEPEGPEDQTT